jgi:hypothetical protein
VFCGVHLWPRITPVHRLTQSARDNAVKMHMMFARGLEPLKRYWNCARFSSGGMEAVKLRRTIRGA